MQTPIIKQLGKQIREKIPVSKELPLPILRALARLANAEQIRAAPVSNSIGEN
jgi:hypothetical protein